MKTILLFSLMSISLLAEGQYFRRYYNLDFAVPKYRDEYFNSGIRTRLNYGGGLPTNYYFTGVGLSINNAALPAPDNIADRLRFVRNNRTGAMVMNNLGYEFRDSPAGSPVLNSSGTSIAEIDNGAGTGGYIAVGYITDNGLTGGTVPGGSDMLYTNLSSTGAVVSARRVDFSKGKDLAWCVRRSVFMAGTWLVCGQSSRTTTSGTTYTDCFVSRLDALGNVIWCFSYNFDPTPLGGISAHCIAKQLCEHPTTGDIYVVGNITDIGPGNTDGLAFALTSGGGFMGASSYDAGKIDQFEAVRFTVDGNLIVGGWSNYAPAGSIFGSNMLIVKLTTGGAILFQNLLRATDPPGANTYDCKAYDIIERINTAGLQEYFLVGPWYDGFGGVAELMYKANAAGFGINNYIYDKMKYDIGFGIDDADNTFPKPGPVIYASIIDPTGTGFSNSHVVRTYYNGATCMNYCPANPPVDIAIGLIPKTLQPFITQVCKVVKLKSKTFNYQSKLQCNQANIGCGSNLKEPGADAVIMNSTQNEIALYPNPASSVLELSLNVNEQGSYAFDITSIAGNLINHFEINLTEGKNSYELNIADLPPGVYMISVFNGSTVMHERFVKE